MKKFYSVLFNISLFAGIPGIAGAAGTYYNGNIYQNPQMRNVANRGGYYNTYGAGRGYGQYATQPTLIRPNVTTQKTQQNATNKNKTDSKKSGLMLDFGVNHEFANWDFEMKTAGSKLQYNNLTWNVLNGTGTYYFGTSTPVQIQVGGRYGKQFGELLMVDDDITNGGLWEVFTTSVDGVNEEIINGAPAMSLGTSKDGTQMGFNAAIGLTDFFHMGNVKITPSVGYRFLKYKLKTQDNAGLMVEVLQSESFPNCFASDDGEIQCSPFVAFLANVSGSWRAISYASIDENGVINVPSGVTRLDLGSTYYYEQPGVSHEYTTQWAGPYVALDMEYDINANNSLVAGIEFGLPAYKSTGNQPYRTDWQHPTSVRDESGIGDAWHIGVNSQWSTKIADFVGLSLGVTYDYYRAKGADAKTFLSQPYYQAALNRGDITQEQYDAYAAAGWVLESKNEVKSIYKSLGARLGLNVMF